MPSNNFYWSKYNQTVKGLSHCFAVISRKSTTAVSVSFCLVSRVDQRQQQQLDVWGWAVHVLNGRDALLCLSSLGWCWFHLSESQHRQHKPQSVSGLIRRAARISNETGGKYEKNRSPTVLSHRHQWNLQPRAAGLRQHCGIKSDEELFLRRVSFLCVLLPVPGFPCSTLSVRCYLVQSSSSIWGLDSDLCYKAMTDSLLKTLQPWWQQQTNTFSTLDFYDWLSLPFVTLWWVAIHDNGLI